MRVLVINAGWEQEPMLRKLQEYDCELYLVHYNNEYCKDIVFKDVLITDLRDLKSILQFAEKFTPQAVISDQCDYSHFAQAFIAETFKLKGPSIEQAQISCNKFLQREQASKIGLTIPDYCLVSHEQQVIDFAKKFGFPVILKPIDNRGSFGVTKINNADEIHKAFQEALFNSHSNLLIVEKFINGFEITVDGYCFDGKPVSLSLAKKAHLDSKTQVSVDIKYPGELSPELYNKALSFNEKVAESLGYSFGMVHCEYIVTPEGEIYLVEAANRGGGVFTSEIIVPEVSGQDIVTRYIDDCFGIPSKSQLEEIKMNEVILKFFSFQPGRIKKIVGLENLKNQPEVLKYRLLLKEGDVISAISNDANRHGFVIVKAKNSVREKAQELINSIKVLYD